LGLQSNPLVQLPPSTALPLLVTPDWWEATALTDMQRVPVVEVAPPEETVVVMSVELGELLDVDARVDGAPDEGARLDETSLVGVSVSRWVELCSDAALVSVGPCASDGAPGLRASPPHATASTAVRVRTSRDGMGMTRARPAPRGKKPHTPSRTSQTDAVERAHEATA
jgi:hypothetical protein